MEPDKIGAEEEFTLGSLVEALIFTRCNRLSDEVGKYAPNTPERHQALQAYTQVLSLANQAQLAKEQARRKLLAVWAALNPAPVFEALTRLDLPSTQDPITTLIGTEVVPLTREMAQEWIVEELALIKEAVNDSQR